MPLQLAYRVVPEDDVFGAGPGAGPGHTVVHALGYRSVGADAAHVDEMIRELPRERYAGLRTVFDDALFVRAWEELPAQTGPPPETVPVSVPQPTATP